MGKVVPKTDAAKMRKQFDRNDRSQVKWLDDAVKEKVQRLCSDLETDLLSKSLIFLLIELPSFEYPVVFREEGVRGTDFGLGTAESSTSVYQIMPDPEMTVDVNPVENKHRIITYRRRRRRGLLDKDVQPNAAERKQIIVRAYISLLRVLTALDRKLCATRHLGNCRLRIATSCGISVHILRTTRRFVFIHSHGRSFALG